MSKGSQSNAFLKRSGSNDRFTGAYMDSTGATLSPAKHARDLNGSPMLSYTSKVQIKPKVLERKLDGNKLLNMKRTEQMFKLDKITFPTFRK